MRRVVLVLLTCCGLAACGGGGTSGNVQASPAARIVAAAPANPASSSPAAVATVPTPVAVAGGQTLDGVNITVAPPGSATPPSAEDLGVNPVSGLGMAANTGGAIHRGSTMRVLLFGPGLNRNMRIRVAGPHDIKIANPQAILATDDTPGLAFTATVSANAALGARTIYLKDANGDETSFTGGLEVVP